MYNKLFITLIVQTGMTFHSYACISHLARENTIEIFPCIMLTRASITGNSNFKCGKG